MVWFLSVSGSWRYTCVYVFVWFYGVPLSWVSPACSVWWSCFLLLCTCSCESRTAREHAWTWWLEGYSSFCQSLLLSLVLHCDWMFFPSKLQKHHDRSTFIRLWQKFCWLLSLQTYAVFVAHLCSSTGAWVFLSFGGRFFQVFKSQTNCLCKICSCNSTFLLACASKEHKWAPNLNAEQVPHDRASAIVRCWG